MKKTIKNRILTIGLIIILCISYYSFFIEPNMLEVTHYNIYDKELSGLKIAFPCDFHIRPYQKERLKKIVEIINKENVDIVLSVGDFVAGHTEKSTLPIEDIAATLKKINSKYGFYTSIGNHDILYDKERIITSLEKNGIKVLDNANIKLNIDGKEVFIAGVDDLSKGKPNIYQALDNTKTPIILLTHSPDIFPKLSQKINLTLAGHTHGGQVRLPFIGSIFTLSKYHNKYAKGYIEENDQKLIVSKGIGESILPIRFNCAPEIVIINFE